MFIDCSRRRKITTLIFVCNQNIRLQLLGKQKQNKNRSFQSFWAFPIFQGFPFLVVFNFKYCYGKHTKVSNTFYIFIAILTSRMFEEGRIGKPNHTLEQRSLLRKYEIPLDHLSFEYIEVCTDIKELERIVRVFRYVSLHVTGMPWPTFYLTGTISLLRICNSLSLVSKLGLYIHKVQPILLSVFRLCSLSQQFIALANHHKCRPTTMLLRPIPIVLHWAKLFTTNMHL